MGIKEEALNYLKKYKWCVLPSMGNIPSKGKVPLVPWKEWQNHLPLEGNINSWWDKWPEANVGVITGAVSGLVVLDVDNVKVSEHLPLTPVSKTTDGSLHYYFKHPGFFVADSAGVIGKGLDLRGDGGFCVLPPSQHFDKKTGEPDCKYEWVIPPTEVDFAPLPQWILDKVKIKKPLGEIVKGISEGSRNTDAASIIGSLLAKYSQNEWESFCWPLVVSWNTLNNPPLPKDELRTIFDSIASREAGKDQTKNSNAGPHIEIKRVFEPILAKDIKTLSATAIDWVIEGLLAKNYLTLLAAREKMGKTSLLKWILKSLALGENFLGLSVIKSRVLVISEENTGHWNRRLYDLGLSDCDSVWFETQPFNTRPKQKEWEEYMTNDVASFCETKKVDVLILDTITPIWPVLNENDASQVQTALLPLVGITKKKVAVLAVHHYSKAGEIRGSTVLGAVPDILLNFSKPRGDEDTTKRLLKCRSRFEESPDQLLLDYNDGAYILLGTPQNVAKQQKLDQIITELRKYPNGATIQELLDGWSPKVKKPSRSMLKVYLNDLCFTQKAYQAGEKEIKGGKAFIYSIYPNNDDNYQGVTNLGKNEAKNPNNHDIQAILLTESVEPKTEPKKLGGKYGWLL